jgi:hypothetical protein
MDLRYRRSHIVWCIVSVLRFMVFPHSGILCCKKQPSRFNWWHGFFGYRHRHTPTLGWISNRIKSRKAVLHISLILGNMGLLTAIYLPHFLIANYFIIETISFFTRFMLSGSMLIYTIVTEMSSNSTRGIAISITNTSVFLFNIIIPLVPYFFITTQSAQFFTYLWILPFCLLVCKFLPVIY